ncbi:hypothetical protein HK098_005868 [Nowakowskiella sp. JEL0407]|nr:hypothetical protein HK098_005868 [Nowakowskiella sp. JEL0407]
MADNLDSWEDWEHCDPSPQVPADAPPPKFIVQKTDTGIQLTPQIQLLKRQNNTNITDTKPQEQRGVLSNEEKVREYQRIRESIFGSDDKNSSPPNAKGDTLKNNVETEKMKGKSSSVLRNPTGPTSNETRFIGIKRPN